MVAPVTLQSIVDELPERELSKPTVKALEQHGKIDRAVVEYLSDGVSYADGSFRQDMVEVFWVEISGIAHVLEFKREGWVKQGTFSVGDVEDIHRTALNLSDHY